MNKTSLTTTAKVILPMMHINALEQANHDPMLKVAGALSTKKSLIRILQGYQPTNVNSAKSTEDS